MQIHTLDEKGSVKVMKRKNLLTEQGITKDIVKKLIALSKPNKDTKVKINKSK